MERNFNPRVIGACLVGFALVAGAYVLSNFGVSNFQNQPAAVVVAQPRVAIEVFDEDNNGIEDWRDQFITTAPIILNQATSTYEPPVTFTGTFGVSFLEQYLSSKTAGPFGSSQEEIIEQAMQTMTEQAVYDLYDLSDITILKDWNEDDLLQYANVMALNISNNNIEGGRGEIDLLVEALNEVSPDRSYMEQINDIAVAYKNMRDTALAIPAPAIASKQHLDLINIYHALYESISSMALTAEDPALALIRLKRYQDDALGLQLALENMYLTLAPYASLFEPNDPALLFSVFSSEFNS